MTKTSTSTIIVREQFRPVVVAAALGNAGEAVATNASRSEDANCFVPTSRIYLPSSALFQPLPELRFAIQTTTAIDDETGRELGTRALMTGDDSETSDSPPSLSPPTSISFGRPYAYAETPCAERFQPESLPMISVPSPFFFCEFLWLVASGRDLASSRH
ncbi:hypothetical protein C8F01DRAFT_319534 [Mycena amicta]|nr:hypothetical protein C8F01DRAFT_319534 [Mycena amicta]